MDSGRALAKVVLCTKNEYDLIEDYLEYYGHLFGFENILVVDNGSTDTFVLDAYNKYSAKGVVVKQHIGSLSTAEDWMSAYIRELAGTCEWVFALETDEFLFWRGKDGNEACYHDVIPREELHAFLKGLAEDVVLCRYEAFYQSCVKPGEHGYDGYKYTHPVRDMVHFADQNWDKVFFRVDKFVRFTQWPHHACMLGSDGRTTPTVVRELGVLHFHNTGAMRKMERSVQILKNWAYFDLKLPVPLQIRICKELVKKHVSSEHRVKYYADVLVRQLIVDTCMQLLKRLPTLEEMMALEKMDAYDDIVGNIWHWMHMPRQGSVIAEKVDDIVYFEWPMAHEFIIKQVANTLKMLQK